MKKLLALSGSASPDGSNSQLLKLIANSFSDDFQISVYSDLDILPLFSPAKLKAQTPTEVQNLKDRITESDALIICTPEYLQNIPAVLKNALEWMTESGELTEKPILAMTFTPHSPRGEYAMKSLSNSLKAMKSQFVAELPLYQNELRDGKGELNLNEEALNILQAALQLL